jgi:hypothetical protein
MSDASIASIACSFFNFVAALDVMGARVIVLRRVACAVREVGRTENRSWFEGNWLLCAGFGG